MSATSATSATPGKPCAFITGAASGIGAAVVRRLAASHALVAADVDAAGLAGLAAELAEGDAVLFTQVLDVTDPAAWTSALAAAEARFGGVDALIQSAGVALGAPALEITPERWREVLAINLDGPFYGAQAAAPCLRRRGGGVIINISSAAGRRAQPMTAAYATSKAALTKLSAVLAREWAAGPAPIRVNTISPGGVKTPLWSKTPWWPKMVEEAGSEEAAWARLAAETPLGSYADAEEIAAAVAFLISDAAAHITGADLVIDGGWSA